MIVLPWLGLLLCACAVLHFMHSVRAFSHATHTLHWPHWPRVKWESLVYALVGLGVWCFA